MTDALMNTYARLPVRFARGTGATLYDTEGRRYLDALSGIAVTGLGHAHPAVTEAICGQAARLLHTSNLYQVEAQEELAELLCNSAGMERVFFCNSGAEANEAALKLARLHARARGIERPAVIVFENAFHGRTLATLSASGNRKIQAGFEPLVSGFVRAPFNDADAVTQIARDNPDIVAVLIEPVQGEGGMRPATPAFLAALRGLCDANNWLLMLDEVQSGNGRTGTYFAYQQLGFAPDVVTTAKGLGNGVPIGACLARGKAAALFQQGHHGSTYGGNPLACATGIAVVRTIAAERLTERAHALGARLRDGFQRQLSNLDGLVEVRNSGLMLGIELDRPCGQLVGDALAAGLLINVTAGNVVRLLPPLIFSEAEADELVTVLGGLIRQFSVRHDGAAA